jgi:hypothetical protein
MNWVEAESELSKREGPLRAILYYIRIFSFCTPFLITFVVYFRLRPVDHGRNQFSFDQPRQGRYSAAFLGTEIPMYGDTHK